MKILIFYFCCFVAGSLILLLAGNADQLVIAGAMVVVANLGIVSYEIKHKIDQRFDKLERMLGA